MKNSTWRRGRVVALVLAALVALVYAQGPLVSAKDAADTTPTFTFSARAKEMKPDKASFGLILETTRQGTADSQFFYRSPEGLAMLKQLGVKSLVYVTDGNNWRALYDDVSGEPQERPGTGNGKGIYYEEAVAIAKAIGAEIVPVLNVTQICEHTPNTPYTSENLKCKHAQAKDAASFVRALRQEAANQGVVFKRVIMGGEPYAGCRYWNHPKGIDCTVASPPGRHRIGLPAEVYADRVNKWAEAIHKIDPALLVGAHFRANTVSCDKECGRGDWYKVVMTDAGKNIDFAIIHQYFMVPRPVPNTVAAAQQYSYYQNQIDVPLRKVGQSEMPRLTRKEIAKTAPANKKDMPIWYSEFHASLLDSFTPDGEETPSYEDYASVRTALYGGLAIGEMYLDLLSPVGKPKNSSPGGARAFYHHLFAYTTFLAANMPIGGAGAQTMVYTPSWHILSALGGFSDKTWLQGKGKSIPSNATGRKSIVGYGARAGKQVTLAFFNHEESASHTIDVKLSNMRVKRATVTMIGDAASSLLSQNNLDTPNAIVPQTTAFPKSQIKNWGLDNLTLPPHSLTVVTIRLK